MSNYEAEEIDNLEKEIIQLKRKLNKARACLKFYASGQHIDSSSIGSSYSVKIEDGTKAKDCLKEIAG